MFVKRGLAALFHGTQTEVWGICESADAAQEADKTEIKDGIGDTVGVMWTDVGKKKYSGVFMPTPVTGEATSPVLSATALNGQPLTVFDPADPAGEATMTIYIDNAKLLRKKSGVPEFQIDGYYYPHVEEAPEAPAG